jgi:tetraacyldisaccharide 4'-kinase
MQKKLLDFWYSHHPLRWLLWPLSLIYQLIIIIRKYYLTRFVQQQAKAKLIVVGNISLGGVGKTPLVIALALKLKEKGYNVGIVSRGYKAKLKDFPHEVICSDSPVRVGDEPLMIASKTGCPVVISPDRNQAVRYLEEKYQAEIIISDDGLQHYAMGRAIEIVVIDGQRGLGNQMCIPAGPLREPVSRLKNADYIVVNSGQWPGAFTMTLAPEKIKDLNDKEIDASMLRNGQSIAAIAGIGNPSRFFNTLVAMGFSFNPYVFADHYNFKEQDLKFKEEFIIMTEKDAMKCRSFANNKMCFLPVTAVLPESFWQALFSNPIFK